ncbi:hypothetical protein CK203_067433 [Vitis vinifera]|uniref:DUF4283 domain-containing protein n=1 Tax=Vitis vinifera TaxID=29760 RepID=A0A438EBN8_VITVI|nr:hypothetical protein CK203_067433 [Vitis vinifera]
MAERMGEGSIGWNAGLMRWGFVGGWATLAKRLRTLGIVTRPKSTLVPGFGGAGSEKSSRGALAKTNQSLVEVAKEKVGCYGEAIWVQIGARETMVREEQFGWCLVGRWGEISGSVSKVALLRSWGAYHWNLKRGLNVARLDCGLLLFMFENKAEAKRVLHKGINALRRIFCIWKGGVQREAFRKIGDCCGGFMAMDKDTASFSPLQWVRVLVKSEGRDLPSSLLGVGKSMSWRQPIVQSAEEIVLSEGGERCSKAMVISSISTKGTRENELRPTVLGLEAVKEVERLEASNLSSLGQAKGEREDYGLWSVETERQPVGSINKRSILSGKGCVKICSQAFVDLLRIIVVDGTMVGGPTSSEVGVVDKVGGTLSARRMGEGLSSTREVTQFAGHPAECMVCTKGGREDFWEELGAIKGLWSDPWCVAVQKAMAMEQMAFWDSKNRSGILSLEEWNAKNEAKEEF